MRSHRTVLRKISEQNLDPKAAHVVDKSGNLKPKKEKVDESKNLIGRDRKEHLEPSSDSADAEQETSLQAPAEEPNSVIQSEEDVKKNKLPPKKKKKELTPE